MRFSAQQPDPLSASGRTNFRELGEWDWLDVAKRAILKERPDAKVEWQDNSEWASKQRLKGIDICPAYDLYEDGVFTGISIIDSMTYAQQAGVLQRLREKGQKFATEEQVANGLNIGDIVLDPITGLIGNED